MADGDWVGHAPGGRPRDAPATPRRTSPWSARPTWCRRPRSPNPVAGDTDPWVPERPALRLRPPRHAGPGRAAGRLEAADLLAVTRVVGRIPDLPGATDPAMLLDRAGHRCRLHPADARAAYQKVFALTATVWKGSTVQSVDLLPGPAPSTHLLAPRGRRVDQARARRAHPLRQLPRRRHHPGLVRPGRRAARSTPSRWRRRTSTAGSPRARWSPRSAATAPCTWRRRTSVAGCR